jgi:two-component system response regulator AtoC
MQTQCDDELEPMEGAPASRSAACSRSRILGVSPLLDSLRERLALVAASDCTVLLRGESGTGKEMMARSIHEQSERRSGPFVAVALVGLPDGLLESELFGYERGAFNGADRRKPGRVELAQGGTLLLDEIGDLPVAMQVKILRLLQEGEYTPLGGTRTHRADVRFVAATHRDLEAMVEKGTFREDLYHRLNVIDVWAPPLRAHPEDIPLLVRAHAADFARKSRSKPPTWDESALAALSAESWPGNVRELLHRVERLTVLARGSAITGDDVRRERAGQPDLASAKTLPRDIGSVASRSGPGEVRPLAEQLKKAERKALEEALVATRGRKAPAARLLGISRVTLYEKLRLHSLLGQPSWPEQSLARQAG